MSQLLNLELHAVTNIGQVRKNNEDNFLVTDLSSRKFWNANKSVNEVVNFETDKGVVLAVADGLGGALAGEVASQMAVNLVREQLIEIQKHKDFKNHSAHEQFRLAIELANKEIVYRSSKEPLYSGMGSTFTGVSLSQNIAYIAQVGDSRCYLIRDNEIKQITKDQSLVGQLLESNYITEEEAENHNLRNVILQALGTQRIVNVVVNSFVLKEQDILLLCSDGLTTHVKNREILQIVHACKNLKQATEILVKLANERGGQDNITIVLARVLQCPPNESKELVINVLPRSENLPIELDLLEPVTLENLVLEDIEFENKPAGLEKNSPKITEEIEEGLTVTSLALPAITLSMLDKVDSGNTEQLSVLKPKSFYERVIEYFVKLFHPKPEFR